MESSSVLKIQEILKNYDLKTIKNISILNGGLKNLSFRIITEDCDYILKKFSGSSKCEIEEMLKSIRQLNFNDEKNLPEVVELITGDLVYPDTNDDSFYALFVYIIGRPGVTGFLTDKMIKNVGTQMAKLHSCQNGEQNLKPLLEIGLYEHIINFLKNEIILRPEYNDDPYIEYLYSKLDFIKSLISRKDISWGVVHADICPSNTIFDEDDNARFIDCEFLSFSPCLLDIGVAIIQCCTDNKLNSSEFTFNINLVEILLEGYLEIKKLSQIELELLSEFSCLGAIFLSYSCFRLSILYDNQILQVRYKLWWNIAKYFENYTLNFKNDNIH
jgi:Ser/Thr protein kinase RdoA (MazF antagonist)